MKVQKQKKILHFFSIGLFHCDKRGRIFRSSTGRELRGAANNSGYLGTTLSKGSKNTVSASVHQIVWLFFNQTIYSERLEINHKNGVKTENGIKNLELVTRGQNNAHAFKAGLKVGHGDMATFRKLSEKDVRKIRKLITAGVMQKEIAKTFGVARNTISNINIGANWSKTK